MARRLDDNPDDLEAQLLGQLEPPTYQPGNWQTQGPDAGPDMQSRETTLREDQSNSSIATKPPASPVAPPTDASGGGSDRNWRDSLQWGGNTTSGFRQDDYGGDQKARNSLKNTVGRVLSRYPPTPEGLRQAMNDPDFKRAAPNARLLEGGAGDKIDFGGALSDYESGVPVGVVDVGQSFDPNNNTGGAWWWNDESNGGGGQAGGGADGLISQLSGNIMGGDPMAAINAQLGDLVGGQGGDNNIQALIEQLLGGQQSQV